MDEGDALAKHSGRLQGDLVAAAGIDRREDVAVTGHDLLPSVKMASPDGHEVGVLRHLRTKTVTVACVPGIRQLV